MISRRILIVITGLVLVASISTLLIVGGDDNDTEIATPITKIPNDGTRRVFIKDFHAYEDKIPLAQQDRIETTLYGHVSHEGPDLYTGVVRDQSYRESLEYSPSGNTFVKKMLVDIEPVKTTFSIEIRQQGTHTYVNIFCAPKVEQIDKSSQCKELELLWD